MLANYHLTENKFLPNILSVGLIPQQGKRSNLIGDHKKAIFYSKGYEGVIAMFFMMIERFVEYRGDYGDIHIDAYKAFMEMARKRQEQGLVINQTLENAINREKRIIDVINAVRISEDWRSFLGEGVCLRLDNVQEENVEASEFTFYNSWTTLSVPPKDISVVVLRNRETGAQLTSKYNIIDYFVSKTPLDSMRKLLYDTDAKESKRESHLLWQIMSRYYSDNEDSIRTFYRNYDIGEVPLAMYLNIENGRLRGRNEGGLNR